MRPWHAAVLYNRDPRFAHRLMALLNAEKEFTIGDNAPYSVSDATDYTIPVHAERRGLHHVLIEIRQNLIADDERAARMGSALGALVAAGICGAVRKSWMVPRGGIEPTTPAFSVQCSTNRATCAQSMIPKSGNRFSEKIMRRRKI